MIHIYFNHEKMMITHHTTLAEMLAHRGYQQPHFAVAINRQFISRGRYATTKLQDGDSIEIISPMQGG